MYAKNINTRWKCHTEYKLDLRGHIRMYAKDMSTDLKVVRSFSKILCKVADGGVKIPMKEDIS